MAISISPHFKAVRDPPPLLPPSMLLCQEPNSMPRCDLTLRPGGHSHQTTCTSRSRWLPPPPHPLPPPQLLPSFPPQMKTSNFQPKLNSWTIIPACSSGSSPAPGNALHQCSLLSAPHSGITRFSFPTTSTTHHLHTLQGAYSYLCSPFFLFSPQHEQQRRAQCSR